MHRYISIGTGFRETFKLPIAGQRHFSDATLYDQGRLGYYWSSSPYTASSSDARMLELDSQGVYSNMRYAAAAGHSVRCFKDSPNAPETLTVTFDENG